MDRCLRCEREVPLDDVEVRHPSGGGRVLCLACVQQMTAHVPPATAEEQRRILREHGFLE